MQKPAGGSLGGGVAAHPGTQQQQQAAAMRGRRLQPQQTQSPAFGAGGRGHLPASQTFEHQARQPHPYGGGGGGGLHGALGAAGHHAQVRGLSTEFMLLECAMLGTRGR